MAFCGSLYMPMPINMISIVTIKNCKILINDAIQTPISDKPSTLDNVLQAITIIVLASVAMRPLHACAYARPVYQLPTAGATSDGPGIRAHNRRSSPAPAGVALLCLPE